MTKNLKRLLASFALLPLAACTMVAAEPAPPSIHPAPSATATEPVHNGQQYVLRPGERASLGDTGSVRYLRLVNDSRCAAAVQCIWAGDAEVAIEWTPAQGSKQVFSLHTGVAPREQAVGDRRLALVSLARGPAPAATLRVDGVPMP